MPYNIDVIRRHARRKCEQLINEADDPYALPDMVNHLLDEMRVHQGFFCVPETILRREIERAIEDLF